MGRYYSGDIEGKFWFGVQPSNDAEFFGAEEQERNEINYYVSKDNIEKVIDGIKKCNDELGENKQKLDDFFNNNDAYNEEMIHEKTGIPIKEIPTLLKWYARLKIGEKIKACLDIQDECYFSAEL